MGIPFNLFTPFTNVIIENIYNNNKNWKYLRQFHEKKIDFKKYLLTSLPYYIQFSSNFKGACNLNIKKINITSKHNHNSYCKQNSFEQLY